MTSGHVFSADDVGLALQAALEIRHSRQMQEEINFTESRVQEALHLAKGDVRNAGEILCTWTRFPPPSTTAPAKAPVPPVDMNSPQPQRFSLDKPVSKPQEQAAKSTQHGAKQRWRSPFDGDLISSNAFFAGGRRKTEPGTRAQSPPIAEMVDVAVGWGSSFVKSAQEKIEKMIRAPDEAVKASTEVESRGHADSRDGFEDFYGYPDGSDTPGRAFIPHLESTWHLPDLDVLDQDVTQAPNEDSDDEDYDDDMTNADMLSHLVSQVEEGTKQIFGVLSKMSTRFPEDDPDSSKANKTKRRNSSRLPFEENSDRQRVKEVSSQLSAGWLPPDQARRLKSELEALQNRLAEIPRQPSSSSLGPHRKMSVDCHYPSPFGLNASASPKAEQTGKQRPHRHSVGEVFDASEAPATSSAPSASVPDHSKSEPVSPEKSAMSKHQGSGPPACYFAALMKAGSESPTKGQASSEADGQIKHGAKESQVSSKCPPKPPSGKGALPPGSASSGKGVSHAGAPSKAGGESSSKAEAKADAAPKDSKAEAKADAVPKEVPKEASKGKPPKGAGKGPPPAAGKGPGPPGKAPAKGKASGKGTLPKVSAKAPPLGRKVEWQPLSMESVVGTVFDGLLDWTGSEEINGSGSLSAENAIASAQRHMIRLVALFKPKETVKGLAKSAPKSKAVQLLPSQRIQNISIALRKQPVTENLLKALATLDYETDAISAEACEMLMNAVPTTEETRLLLGYKGPLEELGKTEQQLLPLARLEKPYVGQRLRVMLFGRTMGELSKHIRDGLGLLKTAFNEARSSKALKVVLYYTVKLGNYINYGALAREDAVAAGFGLDALIKMEFFKASADARLTLLHSFIVSINNPMLATKLKEELANIKPASRLQFGPLTEDVAAFKRETGHIGVCAKSAREEQSSEGESGNAARLDRLSQAATKECEALEEEMKETRIAAKETLSFFALAAKASDTEIKIIELLKLLTRFVEAYERCNKQLEENPKLKSLCIGPPPDLADEAATSKDPSQEAPRPSPDVEVQPAKAKPPGIRRNSSRPSVQRNMPTGSQAAATQEGASQPAWRPDLQAETISPERGPSRTVHQDASVAIPVAIPIPSSEIAAFGTKAAEAASAPSTASAGNVVLAKEAPVAEVAPDTVVARVTLDPITFPRSGPQSATPETVVGS